MGGGKGTSSGASQAPESQFCSEVMEKVGKTEDGEHFLFRHQHNRTRASTCDDGFAEEPVSGRENRHVEPVASQQFRG